MGEIIFSIVIGGMLAASGIGMNLVLGRELKKWKKEDRGRRGEVKTR